MSRQYDLLNTKQTYKEYELLNCNPVFAYHREIPWMKTTEIGLNFFHEITTIIVYIPKKMHIEKPYDETDINNYPIKVKRANSNE